LSNFQHDIVIGAEDSESFNLQKAGNFISPVKNQDPLSVVCASGIKFYSGTDMGLGRKADTQLLFFSKQHVKENYRRNILNAANHDLNQEVKKTDQHLSLGMSIAHRLKQVVRDMLR